MKQPISTCSSVKCQVVEAESQHCPPLQYLTSLSPFVIFLPYLFSFLTNLAPICSAFVASISYVDCKARGRTMPKRKRKPSSDQPDSQPATVHRAFSQYTALSKEEQEIRVVTLHAGADGDPINCTIKNVLLSQAQSFTALSYCWGPEADLAEIVLNGETVTIRRNLWQFLMSLRHLKGTICVWVDYICINQNDVAERGHQVHLMADIYKSAFAVYAWLGDSDRKIDATFVWAAMFEKVSSERRKSPEAQRLRRDGRLGFHSLAAREFWSRLWIVQEVVLAKQLYIVVGRSMVEWDRILDTFSKVAVDRMEGRKEFFKHLRGLRKAQAGGSHPEISSLLDDFQNCQCQDPRDRVYGMLGLLDAQTRSQILVDYSHTLIELFVLNSKLLGPRPSKAKELIVQYPTLEIFDSSIFGIIARICGKDGRSIEVSRWLKDQALPHRSDLSLVLDARAWAVGHAFQTFAAKKTFDCDWEPYTTYNKSQDFAAYMSEITPETSAGIRSKHSKTDIILSRLRPEPGDLLLHLQVYHCIARQVQGSLRVIDIVAGADQSANKSLHNASLHDWFDARVPDIQLHLGKSPSMLDVRPSSQMNTYELHWPMKVNGSALAEGIRLFDNGRRVSSAHVFPIRTITLPWDPRVFIMKSDESASEPTEAQYEELSHQMRRPANMRPAGPSMGGTWHEWDLRNYGQRFKYHECIPRSHTDPLTIPEIAAVPGVAEATKSFESIFDSKAFHAREKLNFYLGALDNIDVLDDFDFDSCFGDTTYDAFNLDSGLIGGDSSVDAGND